MKPLCPICAGPWHPINQCLKRLELWPDAPFDAESPPVTPWDVMDLDIAFYGTGTPQRDEVNQNDYPRCMCDNLTLRRTILNILY